MVTWFFHRRDIEMVKIVMDVTTFNSIADISGFVWFPNYLDYRCDLNISNFFNLPAYLYYLEFKKT